MSNLVLYKLKDEFQTIIFEKNNSKKILNNKNQNMSGKFMGYWVKLMFGETTQDLYLRSPLFICRPV